ncbi:MAG: tetratricopeptide repeat protein [Marinilabiliales bacterium]|nr:tetratricopeptide repeat protein [Marinilabiliales bacterium]
MFSELNIPDAEASVINNIGGILFQLGQYRDALVYFEDALSIDKSLKREHEQASDLTNIGHSYQKLKEYDKAESYYKSALILAEKTNSLSIKMSIYNNLTLLYEAKGIPQALSSYRNYVILKDSMFTSEATGNFQSTRQNSDKREVKQQIKLKNAELQKSLIENKKQKLVIYFFIGGLLLLLLLIIQVYTSLQRKRNMKNYYLLKKPKQKNCYLTLYPRK